MPEEIVQATSALEICQRGAVLVGCQPPEDLSSSGGAEAVVSRMLYESILRAEIANGEWKFCDCELVLMRDAVPPESRFSARYVIPLDARVMHVETVLLNGGRCRYAILEGWVHVDAGENDTVVLIYQKRVDELYWPPGFVLVMIYRMAAIFGTAIAGKAELGDFYGGQAEMKARVGRNRDSQQATTSGLVLNRYRRARR